MATSQVAIANAALQKLGTSRIESLTQDDPNARSMNAAYTRVLEAELRRYRWGFAIKRASIAADSDQTEWGGWNRFSLPNDYLYLIRDDETGFAVDWRIEGLFIVTADAAPLSIRYVANITDPSFYDSLFREAFACKLALDTCKEITGSSASQQACKQEYDWAIAEAKKAGAIEREALAFPEDDWITVRN